MQENKPLISGIDLLMHDIKHPLLSIDRLNAILHEEIENEGMQLPPRLLEIVEKISTSCDSLLKMISPLIEMAVLGDCEVDPSPPANFEMSGAISKAICNVSVSIERSGGEVIVDGDFFEMIGNEERWVRIFQNMINNGLKYNESETPTVVIKGTEDGILIKDNGIGIPEDKWENIFALSFRLHDEKKFGDGTGAGLYISRKFAEWDGGSVNVESSGSDGTTFKIHLPERGWDI